MWLAAFAAHGQGGVTRIVVPFAAGGVQDILARAISAELGTQLGRSEVLAGRAHVVIAANIGALAFVKDARVRMLGATGAKRSKFLPEASGARID